MAGATPSAFEVMESFTLTVCCHQDPVYDHKRSAPEAAGVALLQPGRQVFAAHMVDRRAFSVQACSPVKRKLDLPVRQAPLVPALRGMVSESQGGEVAQAVTAQVWFFRVWFFWKVCMASVLLVGHVNRDLSHCVQVAKVFASSKRCRNMFPVTVSMSARSSLGVSVRSSFDALLSPKVASW